MVLQPRQRVKRVVQRPMFRQVRETPEIVQALAKEAERVGICSSEAIRQIVRAYNREPFDFQPGKTQGFKKAVWANIKADQQTIDAFSAHCQRQGVAVPEGIRQAVRHYLEKAHG